MALVALSTPVIKAVYLFEASISSTVNSTTVETAQLKLGTYGFCVNSNCTYGMLANVTISGVSADRSTDIPMWPTFLTLVFHSVAVLTGVMPAIAWLGDHSDTDNREAHVLTEGLALIAAGCGVGGFIFANLLYKVVVIEHIIQPGASHSLGNGYWMSLVGMLCLLAPVPTLTFWRRLFPLRKRNQL